MMYFKSFKNVMVVSKDDKTKVVGTPFGNIEYSDRPLYPTASCSWGMMNKAWFPEDVAHVYCSIREKNINRVGYSSERMAVAPIVKKVEPSEIVFFHVWNDDENWDQY